MKRRMLPILLSLALCLSLLPTAALAAEEGVTYIERSWDGSTNTVSSVTRTKSAGEYAVIDNTYTPTGWGGWYIARGEVTINGKVTVNGSAQLILEDGCKLTVTQGIQVGGGTATSPFMGSPRALVHL